MIFSIFGKAVFQFTDNSFHLGIIYKRNCIFYCSSMSNLYVYCCSVDDGRNLTLNIEKGREKCLSYPCGLDSRTNAQKIKCIAEQKTQLD